MKQTTDKKCQSPKNSKLFSNEIFADAMAARDAGNIESSEMLQRVAFELSANGE